MKRIIFIISLTLTNLSYGQSTKPDKVEVKKSKNGQNIYNFNFYNKKSKKEEQNKKEKNKQEKKVEKIKDEDLVIYKKRNKIKKGSGIEAGVFTMNHLSDLGDVADLDLGLGLRIGLVLMNESSGIHFTPGIFVMDATANFDGLRDNFMAREYDGSTFGGYFKIGTLIDSISQFSIDTGIEGSYMSGDMKTDNIFGNGSYKLSAANFSAYGGPVFKVDNFSISGLLNIGVSRVSVEESITHTGLSPETSNYSNEKMLPFYGLNINATFVF